MASNASFYVPEGPGGDQALSEAQNHLRDGLSVGFHAKQYAFDDDYNLHVYEGELYEVSLCAIPDFQDAQVTNVAAAASTGRGIMNEAQLRAALAAGTITQAEFDVQLAALTAGTPQPAPAPVVDPALTAGPTPLPASAPMISTQPRPLSLRAAAERVAGAFSNLNGDRAANVRLALNDIVPSTSDAGTGYVGRADWIGELWTASAFSRPWIEAIGTPAELSTMKRKGWRWTTKPTVAEYAGEKAQVPTSTANTEDDEFTAFRVAGGWDFDRIFIDLANDPGYIEAFWQAALDEYKVLSNASIRSRVIAAATAKSAPTSVSTTQGIIPILKQLIRDGRAIDGSNVDRIFLGDTLFTMLEDLNIGSGASIPLWLKNANISANISDATGSIEGLNIALRLDLGRYPVRRVRPPGADRPREVADPAQGLRRGARRHRPRLLQLPDARGPGPASGLQAHRADHLTHLTPPPAFLWTGARPAGA
jgi:hypothetical protein